MQAQSFEVTDKLFKAYSNYKESTLAHRRFKQADILPLISNLKSSDKFDVEEIGKSIENRSIFLIKAGTGKTKVLLWSQMHGDEATATMAIFDIVNFLKTKDDDFESFRANILNGLTLYFIPMLNPDGAEVFKRRNAIDIDLNRDAESLQCPESKILKMIRDRLKPDFGFNLHDQNIRYTAGESSKPATISLLAPPYDFGKSNNKVRKNAIKLIVKLNELLQQYIPGQVGKWPDTFEPRAFGDNIQKWGTSVILVESGGYPSDPEKQFIRKLNFLLLIEAFSSIVAKDYKKANIKHYHKIPENTRYLFDLVIRNVMVKGEGKEYKVDIGINRQEVNCDSPSRFYYKSTIEELGDMSVFYGYEELDGKGMSIEPGKIFAESKLSEKDLNSAYAMTLVGQGFTHVLLEDTSNIQEYTKLPINILSKETVPANSIELDSNANLVIKDKDKVKYVIVNGFVFDVENQKGLISNGLVD